MSRAGYSDREIQTGMEKLAVLAGERKNALGDRAVRLREIKAAVLKMIEEYEEGREEDRFPNGKRIAAFKDGALEAGFYNWRAGQSMDPPPEGYSGGALLMKRRDGNGTWLAADNTGGRGQGQNRLYMRSTSGAPEDWSKGWSEIFHQENVLGAVVRDALGVPRGSLFELVENTNGIALAFAAGFQICLATGRTVAYAGSAISLTTLWTFPRPFVGTPVAFAIAPIVGAGIYTGIAPADLGAAISGPIATETSIGFRKSAGAADFESGDQVTNCQFLAVGKAA